MPTLKVRNFKSIDKDRWMGELPGTLPRQRKIKAEPKVVEKESALQKRTEIYLRARGAAFIRLPDSLLSAVFANRFIPQKDKAFIASFIKGLPDITVFHPTIKVKGKYSLVLPLELKTEMGNMTKAQKEWQRAVGTVEVKGWAAIKSEIDSFLNLCYKADTKG